MLQYHTDEWRNRANWGDADAIPYGAKGTTEKAPNRRAARDRQMGAAGSGGRQARSAARRKDHRHGLHPVRRHGLLGQGRLGLGQRPRPGPGPLVCGLGKAAARVRRRHRTGPQEIKELLKKEPAKLEAEDRRKLRDYFLASVYADPQSPRRPVARANEAVKEKREALDKEIPATMISKELDKPRPAWVLIRGQYDKHGEPVGPGVPAVLPPLAAGEVTNRLTFARWLVDPKHPLTARVTVNRFWQQFFGTGIVKTAEDFGTRGEWPSHPELLDWLATEFIRTGWDVKQLVRLLVTSATYRQDSRVTPRALGHWTLKTACWRAVRDTGWMRRSCAITRFASAAC